MCRPLVAGPVWVCLVLSGCSCDPYIPSDPFNCPNIGAGALDEALQPIELLSGGGEIRFRFEDHRARSESTYRIDVHAIYAECIGTAEPLSASVPATAPGEYVIVAPCETLTQLNLYVASWSVSVSDASGVEIGRSWLVPIRVKQMAQIHGDCGQ